MVGADGNLSVRSGSGILITPSGVRYDRLTEDGLTEIGSATASSERLLHMAVYSAFSEVGAVIHAHPVYGCVLAVLRRPLPALLDEVAPVLGGEVRVARYAPSGSAELGAAAVAALEGRHGAILANHGTVTVGATLEEAFYRLEVLERAATVYVLASGLGEVVLP